MCVRACVRAWRRLSPVTCHDRVIPDTLAVSGDIEGAGAGRWWWWWWLRCGRCGRRGGRTLPPDTSVITARHHWPRHRILGPDQPGLSARAPVDEAPFSAARRGGVVHRDATFFFLLLFSFNLEMLPVRTCACSRLFPVQRALVDFVGVQLCFFVFFLVLADAAQHSCTAQRRASLPGLSSESSACI